jgi:hypothetical protein
MKLYPLNAYTGELIKHDYTDVFPGVYRLHVLDDAGNFRTLPRLFADDPQGILYIGESKNLPSRISALKMSVSAAYAKLAPTIYGNLGYSNATIHPTGLKISSLPAFVERFPFNMLSVSIENNNSHYQREGELLVDYRKKFGDYPSLNG